MSNCVGLTRHRRGSETIMPRCNDLFSRFEQQILFLEKQAEATDPTTDRHGTTDRRRVSFQNT